MQCNQSSRKQRLSPRNVGVTDARLDLVYSTELLRNRRCKLRKERVETGYHIFVALQDLYPTLAKVRDINVVNKSHLLERGLNITVILLTK